jgi:hypothetical protein
MWIAATLCCGERDAAPGFALFLGGFFVGATGWGTGRMAARSSRELPGILSNLFQVSVIATHKFIP